MPERDQHGDAGAGDAAPKRRAWGGPPRVPRIDPSQLGAYDEGLSDRLVRLCEGLGFALAGVCEARPSDRASELHDWLARGMQGSMTWLGDDLTARVDPAAFFPGAKAMILVAERYSEGSADAVGTSDTGHTGQVPSTGQAAGGCDAGDAGGAGSVTVPGRIARYARSSDYHTRIKRRLHAVCDAIRGAFSGHACRAFCDIEPVLEREHALRAGLGWVGKNTLIIHPRIGSYTLLGGIVTTLALRPTRAAPEPDHCGTCTRCIDACPTRAIEPYRVNASRCIAYLTIEHRGPIDPADHPLIGDWLFGCDICQEVCPYNRPGRSGGGAMPEPRGGVDALALLGWTAEDRAVRLSGTALKRARFDMLKRNALIVVGNALREKPDAEALARVRAIADDPGEPTIVRQAAADVLALLGV
jgi:epoxyqueuosine reductase